MTELKLFGTQSPTLTFIKQKINEFIAFHELDVDIVEISQVSEFVNRKLASVPAYAIGDDEPVSRKKSDLNKFIVEACQSLMQKDCYKPSIKKINVVFKYDDKMPSAIEQARLLMHKNMYILTATHVADPYATSWKNPMIQAWESHFVADFHHLQIVESIKFSKGPCKNSDNPCKGCICSPPIHAARLVVVANNDITGWMQDDDTKLATALQHPGIKILITSPALLDKISHVYQAPDTANHTPEVMHEFMSIYHGKHKVSWLDYPNFAKEGSDIHNSLCIIPMTFYQGMSKDQRLAYISKMGEKSNHLLVV